MQQDPNPERPSCSHCPFAENIDPQYVRLDPAFPGVFRYWMCVFCGRFYERDAPGEPLRECDIPSGFFEQGEAIGGDDIPF
jgi:hypothetical protein